jgi:hypothetical protein
MQRFILGTLIIGGLMIGASAVAPASPAIPVLKGNGAVRTAHVLNVDYYRNHRRYKHRVWNKRHRRWRYY